MKSPTSGIPQTAEPMCVCAMHVCFCGYMDTKTIPQVTWAGQLLAAVLSQGIRHWKANERAIR